jgi:hypothetical protein
MQSYQIIVLVKCINLASFQFFLQKLGCYKGCELLAEVHGGECSNHASSRTLVGKAFQHGFYWLTAL